VNFFNNLFSSLSSLFSNFRNVNPLGLIVGGAALLLGGLFNANSNENNSNSVLQDSISTAPTPPSTPVAPTPAAFGGAKDQLVPHITGVSNTDGRFLPDPRIYGTYKIYPVLAARTLTEISGNDQYLTALFSLGKGPLDISEIKIGDKLITEYQDVLYEVRPGYPDDDPITLYTQDVEEVELDLPLPYNVPKERSAGQSATRLSVDIMFPDGLFWLDEENNPTPYTVIVQVDYRLHGSSDPWTTAGQINATEATGSIVRKNLSWTVDRALYDIKLTRLTPDTDPEAGITSDCQWTIIRAFDTDAQPVTQRKDRFGNTIGVAYIAVRIKATEELNGTIDSLSCVAKSMLPIWDGEEWTEPQITNNPAWIYADVLTGTALKKSLSKVKLDTSTLLAWAQFCDAKGYTFNAPIDTKSTVNEVLKQIASVGRASPNVGANGKRSVVIDDLKTVPSQFFTPFNSRDFEGAIQWIEQPQALNVRFINPEANWQTDERVVFDDGYDSSNAHLRETISLYGVTDSDHAWKLGRYYLAQARLRRERFFITVDVENLKCRRGDKVLFNHDVPQFGVKSSRIKSLILNGSNDITGVTLTDGVPTDLNTLYDVTIRMANGTKISRSVIGDGTVMNSLSFTQNIAAATNPKPATQDLVLFGGFVECLVEHIEYLNDLSARLTLIPDNAGIYTADSGTIPPHDPQITIVPEPQRVTPKPVIISVRSDESVLQRDTDGALVTRVQIIIAVPPADVTFHQYQTRISGTSQWGDIDNQPAQNGEIYTYGVQDGSTVDIRVRNVSRLGVLSEWVQISNHFVVGKTTRPPNVPVLERVGNSLRWAYTEELLGQPVPLDFAGFIAKITSGGGSDWDAGIAVFSLTTATQYPLSLLPAGQFAFMLKAVDVAGNESQDPIILRANFGDPLIDNVILEIPEHPEFPGSITNGSVIDDVLTADETGELFWTNDTAKFWSGNNNDLFWSTTFAEMIYRWSFTMPGIYSGIAQLTLDSEIEAENYAIKYRMRGSSLFWATSPGADESPFWSDDDNDLFWDPDQPFVIFPGAINLRANEQVDLEAITAGSQLHQGKINSLTTLVDVPDIEEILELVEIESGGTRLPTSEPFIYIKSVNLTLELDSDNHPNAFVPQLVDRSTAGPLVRVLDVSGDETSGKIHAVVKGY
jgi:hypothetical protein